MPAVRARPPRRALGVALLLAITVQGAFGAASVAAVRQLDAGFGAELAVALERAAAHDRAPGLAFGVMTADGRVWSGVAGTYANGTPLAADDALTIGSVTKTFTAAIVLGLVDEGSIELDAPASRYLPHAAIVRGVTVRQLLNHTSGIPDLYGPIKGRLQGRPGRTMSSNEVLGSVGGRLFAPGTGYAYSNTNYFLLGHIIEVVTHRSFDAELQARYGDRLGLERTRLLTPDDWQMPPAWTTGFWTAGAMVSTAEELARWGEALYGGSLLSDKGRLRMLDFRSGHEYGLGAQRLAIADRWAPGHSGLLFTNTSLLVYLEHEHATVALIATAPNADLEGALTHTFGGPSLLSIVTRLSGY